jgi:hypothetical protein
MLRFLFRHIGCSPELAERLHDAHYQLGKTEIVNAALVDDEYRQSIRWSRSNSDQSSSRRHLRGSPAAHQSISSPRLRASSIAHAAERVWSSQNFHSSRADRL